MNILFYIVMVMVVVLKGSKGDIPLDLLGWEPSTDIKMRAEESPSKAYRVHYPSLKNIQNGRVVLINGYHLGSSMIVLSSQITRGIPKHYHLDLRSGDFYTNAYRWALRAISLLPDWLNGASFVDSQKVWKKRFFYMEEKVPPWLRTLLFYVDDWDRERHLQDRYDLYTKPSFDKHLRFPSKVATDNFESFRQTKETVENLDDSRADTVAPRSMDFGGDVYRPYNEKPWWPPFKKYEPEPFR